MNLKEVLTLFVCFLSAKSTIAQQCNIDFTQYTNDITVASNTFDAMVTTLLAVETQFKSLVDNLGTFFQTNVVSPECDGIYNQIVPVGPEHTSFLACVADIQSQKMNLQMSVLSDLDVAETNCDVSVSITANTHICLITKVCFFTIEFRYSKL